MVSRRELLKLTAGLSLVSAGNLHAQEAWPSRTITMVVPFPPGGTADFAARPLAAHLAESSRATLWSRTRVALEAVSGTPMWPAPNPMAIRS
ncbi:MAG: hypothetical protein QOF14_4476 [Hyphomicrobiales bacterium]|jgi:tripartite-type tricarboxylate transporter receptor subunit TctC|nr:hypothetical protein [Hyphomicrobiales bacterium]